MQAEVQAAPREATDVSGVPAENPARLGDEDRQQPKVVPVLHPSQPANLGPPNAGALPEELPDPATLVTGKLGAGDSLDFVDNQVDKE